MNTPPYTTTYSTNDIVFSTQTTATGYKFCALSSEKGPHMLPIKPIAFFISDDRNPVENFILTQTLHALAQRIGYLPEINILNAQSDQNIKQFCIDHMNDHAHSYSATICLSPWVSASAYKHIAMRGTKLPLLFSNLTASEYEAISATSWVNGVSTQRQTYRRQLLTIRDLMPDLRRVLIPHDMLLHGTENSQTNNANTKALMAECEQQNIEPVMIGTLPIRKLAVDIRAYRPDQTLFVMTRENTIINQMHDIISTCNKHRMPIFSDLPLPTLHGAAFGTGTSGARLAQPLAEMIYQVVVQHRKPGELQAISVAESDMLLYNKINFARQGIMPHDEQIRLLEAQEILLYARNQELI